METVNLVVKKEVSGMEKLTRKLNFLNAALTTVAIVAVLKKIVKCEIKINFNKSDDK